MQAPRPRQRTPDGIQLQPRDKNALLMIYLCDGLMSEEQLVRCCYGGTHPKNAKKRLLALFDNKYLNRNWKPERWQFFPRLLYWLAGRGYDEVGQLLGAPVDRSNKLGRSRSPLTLAHHLQIVDFRLKVMADVEAVEDLHLGRWFTEGFFRSRSWQGQVKLKTAPGKVEEKAVEPDGFFPIWRWSGEERQQKRVFGFTLEMDRATEVQQITANQVQRTTIEEKLRKGAALLSSPAYMDAFQLRTGRALMVTTGWERAENMMLLAEQADVGWAWYFTTLAAALNPERNLLVDPIWRRAGRETPVALGLLPHKGARAAQKRPAMDSRSANGAAG